MYLIGLSKGVGDRPHRIGGLPPKETSSLRFSITSAFGAAGLSVSEGEYENAPGEVVVCRPTEDVRLRKNFRPVCAGRRKMLYLRT